MSFESRLGNRGLGRVKVGLSESDYEQPKCAYCGKPISDDRLLGLRAKYCRTLCGNNARLEQAGKRRVAKRGQYVKSPWRKYYDRARAVSGQWVEVRFRSTDRAILFQHCCNNTKDLEALRTGVRVSIRQRAA